MTNECMNRYKNQFAIEFAKTMQINLPQWQKWQKEYTRKLYGKGWLTTYFLSFLAGFMPGKNERHYSLKVHFVLAVILCIASICTAISLENKNYQFDIKNKLFPLLLSVFSKDIIYGVGGIPYIEYNTSLLLNKDVGYDFVDDNFSGVYNDVPFVISESEISNIKKFKNGKSERKLLFKGIAMHFKMQKKIKFRVLIYSKNIFNRVPDRFEKVTMESDEFNKKYNVYVQKGSNADGQLEARYLFNTVFLERFMQLQTSFKVDKIRCSICENSVLILLETKKDLFEMNHLLNRIDDINQYNYLFDEFASIFSFVEILNLSSRTGL